MHAKPIKSALGPLVFNTLTLIELQKVVGWAEQEGWNPGTHDAEIFYQTDPQGFIGCFIDGVLIGAGSVVAYGEAFGFMGFFIVHPDYRGQGIGEKLWLYRRDTLLARLNSDSAIGMDGVVAMQPFYKKGGFNIAFRDERYQLLGQQYSVSEHVRAYCQSDYNAVQALDLKCFGFARDSFLKPWLVQQNAFSFIYRDQQELKGFAVLRKAAQGYKIGPLFAEKAEHAQALLMACLNEVPKEKVFIDIPVINQQAKALVARYQGLYVFECARMYYGSTPQTTSQSIYGITSFELG